MHNIGRLLKHRYRGEALTNSVVYSTFTQRTNLSTISLLYSVEPTIYKLIKLSDKDNFELVKRPTHYCPIIIFKYNHSYLQSKIKQKLVSEINHDLHSSDPEYKKFIDDLNIANKLYMMTDM